LWDIGLLGDDHLCYASHDGINSFDPRAGKVNLVKNGLFYKLSIEENFMLTIGNTRGDMAVELFDIRSLDHPISTTRCGTPFSIYEDEICSLKNGRAVVAYHGRLIYSKNVRNANAPFLFYNLELSFLSGCLFGDNFLYINHPARARMIVSRQDRESDMRSFDIETGVDINTQFSMSLLSRDEFHIDMKASGQRVLIQGIDDMNRWTDFVILDYGS